MSPSPLLKRYRVTSPYRPGVQVLVYAHGLSESKAVAKKKSKALSSASKLVAKEA